MEKQQDVCFYARRRPSKAYITYTLVTKYLDSTHRSGLNLRNHILTYLSLSCTSTHGNATTTFTDPTTYLAN